MEWMWIPGVVTVAAVICAVVWFKRGRESGDWVLLTAILLGLVALVGWPGSAAAYYDSRDDAMRYNAYYMYVLKPLATEDRGEYIILDSFKAGTWNEGAMLLQEYNSYLIVNRYWDKHWLWGTLIYPAPEHLKPAKVAA